MKATEMVELISQLGSDANVPARVKALREAHGWSLQELVDQLAKPPIGYRMSKSSLWKIESGTPPRQVSFREAAAFAAVFKVSLENLYLTEGQIAQRSITDAAFAATRMLTEAHEAWVRYAEAVDQGRRILSRVAEGGEARRELVNLRERLKAKHEREALKLWKIMMTQRIEEGATVDEALAFDDDAVLASEDFARFERAVSQQPVHTAIDDILDDVILARDALLPNRSRTITKDEDA